MSINGSMNPKTS